MLHLKIFCPRLNTCCSQRLFGLVQSQVMLLASFSCLSAELNVCMCTCLDQPQHFLALPELILYAAGLLSLSWKQPPTAFQVCSDRSKAGPSAERECQQRRLRSQRRWDPFIQVLAREKMKGGWGGERIVEYQLTSNNTADQSPLNVLWGARDMCWCTLLFSCIPRTHTCTCIGLWCIGFVHVFLASRQSEALNLVHLLKPRLPRRTSVALCLH